MPDRRETTAAEIVCPFRRGCACKLGIFIVHRHVRPGDIPALPSLTPEMRRRLAKNTNARQETNSVKIGTNAAQARMALAKEEQLTRWWTNLGRRHTLGRSNSASPRQTARGKGWSIKTRYPVETNRPVSLDTAGGGTKTRLLPQTSLSMQAMQTA